MTPYGALQAQDFSTPAYSESDVTGGGFGLSYAAMNVTDVRTELGMRVDDPTLLYGKPLILFGRLAWAHDFVSNPSLSAAFQALPGSSFTVNGAPIPHDSALTTAGLQYFLTASWQVIAKFDGDFAAGSQLTAARGRCVTLGERAAGKLQAATLPAAAFSLPVPNAARALVNERGVGQVGPAETRVRCALCPWPD